MHDCYYDGICGIPDCQCPACKASGINYIGQHLYLPNSRIPKAYLPSIISPADIIRGQGSELRNYARELIKNVAAGKGAYLYSSTTGNGKTTVACGLLLKYLYMKTSTLIHGDHMTPIMYLNVVEFLESLRRSMNTEDKDLDNLLMVLFDPSSAPTLLVLDDIGAEKVSEWVTERLYSLINFRVSNKLTTIYTSNCSPEDLSQKLGHRCYSRIVGNSIIIKFIGTDRRVGA